MNDVTAATKVGVAGLPLRVEHIMERMVDGSVILFDPERERVHELNPVASFVWLCCDGEHSAADIVAALVEHYPDNETEIRRDVSAILLQFDDQGLLVPVGQPA